MDAFLPHVERRDAVPTIGITRAVSMDTIPEIADRIPEIVGALLTAGADLTAAPYLRYHVIDMDRTLVVEAGVPVEPSAAVDAALTAHPELERGEIPAGRYAVAVHHGHPDGLVAATGALLAWAAGEGLEFDRRSAPEGDVWAGRMESYLTDPREAAMEDWDTELAFRLLG